MTPAIEATSLVRNFGEVHAVRGVSLPVQVVLAFRRRVRLG